MIGTGIATLVAGLAGAGAATASAKMSTNANNKATQLQIDAANRAAELQKQSNDAALAFQERESAAQRAAEEVNRRANYDQYVAQRRKLSAVGQSLGLGGLEIPDYVPLYQGQGPNVPTVAGARGGPDASGPAPTAPTDPAQLEAFIKKTLADTGQDPNTSGYWVGKWGELTARGQQLNDPNYAVKRLQGWQAGGGDVPRSGPYAGMGGSLPQPVGSVASYMPRQFSMPTPTLALPDPYRIQTVAGYR